MDVFLYKNVKKKANKAPTEYKNKYCWQVKQQTWIRINNKWISDKWHNQRADKPSDELLPFFAVSIMAW